MTPNLSDMVVPAAASIRGGADGIAAINTIKSITRVDLNKFSPYPIIGENHQYLDIQGKP